MALNPTGNFCGFRPVLQKHSGERGVSEPPGRNAIFRVRGSKSIAPGHKGPAWASPTSRDPKRSLLHELRRSWGELHVMYSNKQVRMAADTYYNYKNTVGTSHHILIEKPSSLS